MKITDPILGQDGEWFNGGKSPFAAFRRIFIPTGKPVSIWVDVAGKKVPLWQSQLFLEIEGKYPDILPQIISSLLPNDSISQASIDFQKHYQLSQIDIRGHIPPMKCILHYKTDLEFDWYVGVNADYGVEYCGERD